MSTETDHGTSAMAGIWLVARREVRARFLAKSNIISMTILSVIIVAGILAIDFFGSGGTEPEDGAAAAQSADYTVSVAEETADLIPYLETAAAMQDTSLDTSAEPPASEEERAEIDAELSGAPDAVSVTVSDAADPTLVTVVTEAMRAYVLEREVLDLGGDPDSVSQALAEAMPQIVTTDAGPSLFGADWLVAVMAISVLLFLLIGTGSLIATGVVEEKTSRVVEILLATIRPSQLLAGKILGIGIVGLLQLLILGVAAVVPAAATGVLEGFEVDVGSTLGMLVVWFLLGYTIYALLFGGLAALISRQEEIGAVTTPLMFLLFVPFYLSMYLVPSSPDSTLTQVLSHIPLFSPFLMPMRQVFGALPAWELWLSVGISVATIPLLVLVAGRIYRRGVLHTGGRMKLTEALKG